MSPDLNPESVRAILRKDFNDAIRSRGLLILTGVFVVFFGTASFLFADLLAQVGGSATNATGANATNASAAVGRQLRSTDAFLRALTNVTRLLVPLIGGLLAYASIVGEWESGTLKLLLSLPHSRLDVVAGKFLGRGSVLAVPVLLGFLVAIPVFLLAGTTFNPGPYIGFALLTVLVGLVFVAIGIGASAATTTGRRAVLLTFGPYVLFSLFWGQIRRALFRQVQQRLDLGQEGLAEAFFVLQLLNPIAAYESLTSSLVSGPQVRLGLFSPPTRQSYAQQFGSLPPYLSDPALVVYLLLWLVVPLVAGYYAFERTDL